MWNPKTRCRVTLWASGGLAIGLLLGCNVGTIHSRADGSQEPDAGTNANADATLGPDAVADAGPDAAPDAAPPLPCDLGFTFLPDPAETGQLVEVSYSTTSQGYTYVGLDTVGPGTAERTDVTLVSGQSPWSWMWLVALDAGGLWTFTFTAGDPSADIASCQIQVADTGPPPDLPGPSCANQVCGEPDGNGGTCTRCPMQASEGGLCLDPPSPIGPSGPGQTWDCLDTASCQSWGQCRIWCPGEPCRTDLHPDGCPQGVETCYVDPHITDYEEACRQCCESRFHNPTGQYACWDNAYNICRYPTDCGQPYPLP